MLFEALQSVVIIGQENNPAVSAEQLGNLVAVLSGHSQTLTPEDILNSTVDALNDRFNDGDNSLGGSGCYDCLENRDFGCMICTIFNLLQDDTISKVRLQVNNLGCCIAAVFLWLLPHCTKRRIEITINRNYW